MKTSLPRVLVALLALAFVLAACASETGSQWTFAPSDGSDDGDSNAAATEPAEPEASAPTEPVEPEEPAASEAPAEPTEPEEPAEPVEPAEPPSGEARVIEMQADSALRFTDGTGQPLPTIELTPGETVVFRIDNTAGFAHNFWIGEDAELSVPAATTDVGIADWSTGVQELEWVVPEDVSDLKFACTVPGHYYTMQGTFTAVEAAAAADTSEPAAAEEPAEPEASAAPEEPAEPAEPVEPAAPPSGEARVIELEADAAIRFMQDGEQIQGIEVTPGETVVFRIDNTAGFPHNFYIGPDDDLRVMGGTTDTGIPDWDIGVQELEWVVPDDVSDIRFACTVPGHYFTMQGDFTVTP
jgi:uncharacterized cupredoxin-like copper-binding protein